jgi:hypothetical protein
MLPKMNLYGNVRLKFAAPACIIGACHNLWVLAQIGRALPDTGANSCNFTGLGNFSQNPVKAPGAPHPRREAGAGKDEKS